MVTGEISEIGLTIVIKSIQLGINIIVIGNNKDRRVE